jgi:hypothetical protein
VTATDRVTSQGENQHLGALVLHVPPPLHYGAAFAAGMLLRAATVPLALGGRPPTAVIGAVVLAAGAALALAGIIEAMRRQTTIVPRHAVSALVTTGAYRISRNPIYPGLAIAYLGGALLTGWWWPLATFPLALLAVRDIAIGPKSATSPAVRPDVPRLPDARSAMALAKHATPRARAGQTLLRVPGQRRTTDVTATRQSPKDLDILKLINPPLDIEGSQMRTFDGGGIRLSVSSTEGVDPRYI